MSNGTRHPGRTYVLEAIGAVDAAVGVTRSAADRVLERLQLTLYKWRLAVDPDTRVWADQVDRELRSGTLQGARTDEDFEQLIKEERSRTS
jgi:hypothetical protein